MLGMAILHVAHLFTAVMLHQNAFDHTQRARQLLDGNTAHELTYAALEARMAIEELFYALLPLYEDELPTDITQRWQPQKVIEAILECDPMAEQYQQVTISTSGDDKTQFVGQYTPANRQLIKDHYHKLGSYLHAQNKRQERDLPEMRKLLEAALDDVERRCKETTMIQNIQFGTLHHKCVCGRIIKRNFLAAGFRPLVRCPDEKCRALFHVRLIPGSAVWTLQLRDFKCSRCRVETPLPVHKLQEGYRFNCIGCGSSYEITIGPIAVLRETRKSTRKAARPNSSQKLARPGAGPAA